jgi:hypothetical protein
MPVHILSRSNRRYNVNDYAVAPGTGGDRPSNYSLLAWWRASDLSGIYTNGQTVVTWNSVGSTYVASAVNTPTYTAADIANGPTVTFNGSSYFTLSPSLNLTIANWTVAVVCHIGQDSEVMGNNTGNYQMRKFRSGANTISVYNGTSEDVSSGFSSTGAQPVICWYVFGGNTISYYENTYTRGGPNGWTTYPVAMNELGTTGIGGTAVGGISEYCIWNVTLNSSQISSLFATYFQVRYPNVFYTV